MKTVPLILSTPTLWMAFAAPIAIAQIDDIDKIALRVSIFFAARETDTRFDTIVGAPGSNVDLEDVLGLDKSNSVFRADGHYHFSKQRQINLSVFDSSRTASVQLQEDLDWDGTVFVLDTVVNSEFDLKIYKAAYTSTLCRIGLRSDVRVCVDGIG